MEFDKLTPMMKQYFEIKNEYKDYILFYRLGDFYEMFFDDAVTASRELELTLTGRNCGMADRAPLCGIPHHAADVYIGRMVEKGYKVAICEQVEDPATAKGIVKREVVRIITPGTVIDPSMLDESKNNFILSLSFGKYIGIAYADISTGTFRATLFPPNTDSQRLLGEIQKIEPSEIVLSKSLKEEFPEWLNELNCPIAFHHEVSFKAEHASTVIQRTFGVFSIESLGLIPTDEQTAAIGGLLAYIEDTQKVPLKHFDSIEVYNSNQYMMLDRFTRRNLELTETMREKSKKGSLLWVIDRTCTAMGSRKIRQWMEQPLLELTQIQQRLDTVEKLHEDLFLREDIKLILKQIYDLERLSSKLVYGNANGRDLIALKNSLTLLPDLKVLLSQSGVDLMETICSDLDTLQDLKVLIDEAIEEEPPFNIKEGGLIKASYNSDLAELRAIQQNGKDWLLDIESQERVRTGIKSLKIGFNKVFGYYIDITKSNNKNVPENYIRKQTLSNSERYITPELKSLEEKVLGAEEKMAALEYQLFLELRDKLVAELHRIKKTADAVASTDVLYAFAETSYQLGYCKPKVSVNSVIHIEEGRHPVVERLMTQGQFVPNSTVLDQSDNQLYIITGPNMAGKSTYLRQVALITLLAQIGCFVPAHSAEIAIVDRIFTRVGASDDLAQGQSTFMVEMNELANILNNATASSLIILDEIGRGTSTYDGLSIAWSVVEYLSKREGIGAKTMFATHYHELTELEGHFHGIKNYCIAVKEIGDDIVFLRKIIRGGANQSYGIQVAKLAGLPEEVITRAKEILKCLEASDITNNSTALKNATPMQMQTESVTSIEKVSEPEISYKSQLSFFEDQASKAFIEKVAKLSVVEMTPMSAMNELYELVHEAKRRLKGDLS